jgi:hypothetical protein
LTVSIFGCFIWGIVLQGRRNVLTLVLVAMGLWRLGHDVVTPYRTPWDRTARDFARWFWDELSADAELVCVRTDLGIPFRPESWTYAAANQYLCLQRIYSRRHQQRRPPDWDNISAERPLRCVLLNRMPTDVPAFLNWIETHRDRYRLQDVRTYPASRGSQAEPAQIYVVCEFAPVASMQTESNSPSRAEVARRSSRSRSFSHQALTAHGPSSQPGGFSDTIAFAPGNIRRPRTTWAVQLLIGGCRLDERPDYFDPPSGNRGLR